MSTLTVNCEPKAKIKNPLKLIEQMKYLSNESKNSYRSAKTCPGTISDFDVDWDYIFSNHKISKIPEEREMARFLDKEGIFAINLKVCLQDYNQLL